MANPGLIARYKGIEYIVLVDDGVFEAYKNKPIRRLPSGYVTMQYCVRVHIEPIRSKRMKTKYLHREIQYAPPGLEVDHINRDKLDNRRENLRIATRRENSRNTRKQTRNTSGFKAVYFNKKAGRFFARTRDVNGRDVHLGYRETAEECHALYCDYVAKNLPAFGVG